MKSWKAWKLIESVSVLRPVLLACVISLGLIAGAAPASSAVAQTGWLRLAHLSPNTPAVDVYLYSFRDPAAKVVLPHVSYGTVSPYLPAAPGFYTVAMRLAGAAPKSKPVLSTGIEVRAGEAYTVAGMGPLNGLRLEVFGNRLAAPPRDAMVRVIQASMRQEVMTVRVGARGLGRDLAFATVSKYRAVTGGRYAVRAAGASEHTVREITLQAGSIHTLVVLDVGTHLKIVDLLDAVGSPVLPSGAPATGLGGAASRPGPSKIGWLAMIAAGLLLAVAGLGKFRRSRAPLRAR